MAATDFTQKAILHTGVEIREKGGREQQHISQSVMDWRSRRFLGTQFANEAAERLRRAALGKNQVAAVVIKKKSKR